MAATKSLIRKWIVEGMEQHAMYLICICDVSEHEDYAVYTESPVDLADKLVKHGGPNMQKVKEVYFLQEPLCWKDLQSPSPVRRDLHVPVKLN